MTPILFFSKKAQNQGFYNIELMFKLARIKYNLKKYSECIQIYEELLESDRDNATYLNNVALALYENGNIDKAIERLKASLSKKDGSQTDNEVITLGNLLNYFLEKRKTDSSCENEIIKTSSQIIENIINQNSAESHNTNDGIRRIQGLKLYKYKTFTTNTMDSLLNDYFFFSEISRLNDPLDIPLIEISNKESKDWIGIERDEIKVLSLTQEENNTLMWAHYADAHKGICIGYRITSLPKFVGWNFIKYVPENFDRNKMNKGRGLIPAGFFSKHINWKYEKEVRLVTYKNNNNKIYYAYPVLPIERSKKIEAYVAEITVGYKFQESNLKILRSIVKQLNHGRKKDFLPAIKIYKAKLDPEYPFKLKKEYNGIKY